MVLTLSSNATATAQKHRHTPRTEQVSDTVKHNPDAIEAFSDTTAAKSNANADFDDDDDNYTTRHHVTLEGEEAGEFIEKIFGGLGIAMIIPILAIVIFGLLLPLIILFTVLYFVNRNRRDKYRLAEMAIKNGQPIPDELLKEVKDDWDSNSYNAGIRQMFTGVGLAIFLGIILDELGIGIGALVFFSRYRRLSGLRPHNGSHSLRIPYTLYMFQWNNILLRSLDRNAGKKSTG